MTDSIEYLVMLRTGEYGDAAEYPVCVFPSEAEANKAAEAWNEWARKNGIPIGSCDFETALEVPKELLKNCPGQPVNRAISDIFDYTGIGWSVLPVRRMLELPL